MLSVGVLGCGKASQEYHLPVVEAIDDLELSWVCDLDGGRAEAVGREYGVRSFSDSDAAIENTPDVVHVNTPPFTHCDLATTALEAGAHVLVEKPMAMTTDECRRMESVADEAARKLGVVHNNLYFDPMSDVLESIRDGEFGDVVSVRSFLGGQPDQTETREWVSKSHGGPIGDRLPHPVYLVTHFLDDVSDVHVVADERVPGELDGLHVQVGGDDVFGDIQVSEAAIPAKNVYIVGERKLAYVDLFNYVAVEYDSVERSNLSIVKDNLSAASQLLSGTTANVVEYARDTVGSGSKFAAPGHYNLIRRFARSVSHDTLPPVPAGEGLKVVKTLREIDAATATADRIPE